MKSLSTGIEFLPLRTCFGILHGQVTRDLLSNLYKPGQSISVSSFRRKPESRLFLTPFWIPACAGTTDQRFFEQVNLDKPDYRYFQFSFILFLKIHPHLRFTNYRYKLTRYNRKYQPLSSGNNPQSSHRANQLSRA